MSSAERADFGYPFSLDPGLHAVAEEPSYGRHVDHLVRQVLFTNPGERVNRPDFGCGLRRMVFAPNSDVTASLTQVTVLQALERWLGDVIRVDTVETSARQETLEVRVSYTLRQTGERRYLNVEVGV